MIGKKGFTLIEVLVVVIIISVGILGAYQVVNHSLSFVNSTRVKVLAINYAREGIEGVFNIRDTNWRRWSGAGLRDSCWLKVNPLEDEGGDGCENDEWFGNGSYILKEQDSTSNQKYYILSGISYSLDIKDDYISDQDADFLLCKSADGEFIKACPTGTSAGARHTNTQGLFFREIQGGYLIDKDADNAAAMDLSACDKGDDNDNGTIEDNECGDDRFKEKNFCSIVQYSSRNIGEVKLCASMTNFRK